MNIRSLFFFKLIISLCLFIVGLYFFIQGKSILEKNKVINVSKISFNEIKNQKKNNLNIKKFINENDPLFVNKNISLKNNLIKENNFNEKIIIVKKNDTFSKIIDPFFDDNNIKNSIINKLNDVYNLKQLTIGQKIYFYKNYTNQINKIVIPLNFTTDIILEINSDSVVLNKDIIVPSKEINSIEFIIFSSLYQDGIKAGVPLSILTDTIKLYSFDIDFQRDIQKNTKFEVSYETLVNPKKKNISYGNIQYINLKIQNKNLEYFLFKTEDGFSDYYNKNGKNVKKSLLKTPIDGAKLSSNFGMRKHPILGYTKLHKGVDFAANVGTPVFAGGNGVIDYIGNNGSYGKYIRIRHNNEYKTAYAHLSGFKKGIAKGTRVNQSDIIGYVGNTGNSTGPHLHYEVLFQNKQINPMKMKLPSGRILLNKELIKFKNEANDIYAKHLFTLYE